MNHGRLPHLCLGIGLLAPWFLVSTVHAQSVTTEQAEKTKAEQLFGQALALLPEDKIPAEFLSQRAGAETPKCGTMTLAAVERDFELFSQKQQAILARLFVRPSLPFTYVSPSGEFTLHYTLTGPDAVTSADLDGNDVPDYVDQMAIEFDRTFDLQINDLGYQRPPSDDDIDGPQYDVYILGLSSGFYGLTTPDPDVITTPSRVRASFIQADNDFLNGQFTQGLGGVQVTAAHEYFHAIQFGYRTGFDENDFWYYELCSTWMEDVVYDDVNDYYSTVPQFLRRTGEPFNIFDRFSLYNYGASIWYLFLMQKYDDLRMVRRTWEIMASQVSFSQGSVMAALTQMLTEKTTSFANEFAEFAVWNHFTGNKANPAEYYEEGANYRDPNPNGSPYVVRFQGNFVLSADTTLIDSSLASSHRYYRFDVFQSNPYVLAAGVDRPSDWRFAAIVTTPQGASTVQIFTPTQSVSLGSVPQFSEIVVVAIDVRTFDGSELSRLRSDRATFSFTLLPGAGNEPGERAIASVYPSPFRLDQQSFVNLKFNAGNPIDVEVRILSASGVLLRTIRFNESPGAFESGPEEDTWIVSWDGTSDQNEPVASGIYLFQLRQEDFIAMEKFALIRE